MDAKPTLRLRANFSVTTKGVYTPEVTAEITGIELTANDMETAIKLIEGNLSELHDKVVEVAESKGYVSSLVEQKK